MRINRLGQRLSCENLNIQQVSISIFVRFNLQNSLVQKILA